VKYVRIPVEGYISQEMQVPILAAYNHFKIAMLTIGWLNDLLYAHRCFIGRGS
jgi:hypothetical protein